ADGLRAIIYVRRRVRSHGYGSGWIGSRHWNGNVQRTARIASCGIGQKRAVLQARGPVKENVVKDHVIVEQPDARANAGLAITLNIPGNSHLRSKVPVRLMYRISVSGEGSVQFRNGAQIAVGSARVAVPTQARSDGQIPPGLPGVANI